MIIREEQAMVAKRIFLSLIVAVALGLAGADQAAAQAYPSRLIKIVVPYPAGGPSDVAARLVAQPMSAKLGQTVIIENLPGAGGRTGAKAVSQATPDGYTLLLGGTNPNAIAQSIYRSLNFEPIRDFTPVGVIGVDSNALVVNPAVPAKNIQELIEYAKANPGKLSAGATVGIGPHVSLELVKARSGHGIAFIPYKGAAPAISDLLGNQIQVGMTTKAVLLPLIKDGKLRALAVTSDARWPDLPDVPTLRESGFDGIPAYLFIGLLAPVQTPAPVIEKLNAAMNEGMRAPEMQASIAKLGLETRSLTSAQFAAALADETRLWEAAVKESGVKLD
jgi:tripartite-type tricarboxylate transporter receptor subunit TctC